MILPDTQKAREGDEKEEERQKTLKTQKAESKKKKKCLIKFCLSSFILT